ncbi:MAG: hypothetical protein KC561_00595 [Myxococcales bacterium]|nr:hypothetical protein [Myxococcales bacterium]
MNRALAKLITLALALLALTAGVRVAGAQGDLSSLLSDLDSARQRHTQEVVAFEERRERFEALLVSIDVLKEEREGATVGTDSDLRELLRTARTQAENLSEQRDQIEALASRISILEQTALVQLEERQLTLEGEIRSGAGDRAQLLVEAERLSALSASLVQPLEPMPEVPIDEILVGLSEDVTPEELLATADELEDNARRLEAYLDELDTRIEEASRRRELRVRAGELSAERNLFAESTSGGRVQRSASGAETSTDSSQDSGTVNTATAGGQGGAETRGTQSENTSAPAAAEDQSEVDNDSFDGAMGAEGNNAGGMSSGGSPDFVDDSSGGSDVGNNTGSQSPDPADEFVGDVPLVPAIENPPSITAGDPVMMWLESPNNDDSARGTGGEGLNELIQERQRTVRTLEQVRGQQERLLRWVDEIEAAEGF